MSVTPDLMLRLELSALQDDYIRTIDEDRLEDWPRMFLEDGFYEIIPKENEDQGLAIPLIHCTGAAMMRDRVLALRNANIYEKPVYRHFFSGLHIVPGNGETIAMTSNYLVVNTSQNGTSTIYQAGLYQDLVVKTDAGWRFSKKRCIYDTLRVQTLLAYPI